MLYIFVEGPDDEKFISSIYGLKICNPKFIKYSGLQNSKIKDFIRSIECTPMCDYIFLGDADGKEVLEKKSDLLIKYPNLSLDKTYIVQFEIESWYYAGIGEEICHKLKLKHYVYRTDALTKELFYAKLSRPADKKYILAEILKLYSIDLAVHRNYSLERFHSSIVKEPA
jgi:hypothetical protein